MIDILGKLLGGNARVKLLRLFLFNPEEQFETKDIKKRSSISSQTATSELSKLSNIGLIKKRQITKETVKILKSGKKKVTKRKAMVWELDSAFPYVKPLRSLLLDGEAVNKSELKNRFKKIGKVKLLIVSGVFIQEDTSRTDIFIVCDKHNQTALDRTVKILEAELGRELSYVVFDSKEFMYRIDMNDKLVRDILDYGHEVVVDTFGGKILF